ncbi:MAG: hypothetical protein B6U94_03045 [Thermofilum sp. ex4484_79]|nr:MAG: hypothetical protein B6U94_03045 [Thermofilum sp. ex4484_79]
MNDYEKIFQNRKTVVSLGNCNVDLVYLVDKIPLADEEALAVDFKTFPGGSASNFAVAISKFGYCSKMIGILGSDHYGNFLLDNFKQSGVDVSKVRIVKGPTGRVLILVEKGTGNRAMIAFRGVNLKLSELNISEKEFENVDHFHTSSTSIKIILDVFKKAKNRGCTVSYDPGGPVVRNEYMFFNKIADYIDILFLNKIEYEILHEKGCIDYFFDNDVLIVVKMGKKGSAVYQKDKITRTNGFSVKVVDTTGAGDVFDAGFVACWLYKKDPRMCSIFANAVAALKIQKMGAQAIPDKDEVFAFLKDHDIF